MQIFNYNREKIGYNFGMKNKSAVKTFGILTSGGDAPGLNAAIRGVCRSAMINYGMKVVGIKNGYRGLINGEGFPIT